MLQRLQTPLNLITEGSSPDLRNSEAARLRPDPNGDDSYDDELMRVGQFEISDSSELRLVAINEPDGVGAERLRTLASRLKRAQHRHAIKKLLVTSAVSGEGKTLISANLAITLAMQQQRTLLIDGDLRGGSLGELFNTENQPGLADWWGAMGSIMKILYRAQQLPLWVLPAGKYYDRPLNILQSSEFAELLTQLSAMFDWVLIDSPPLTPFADGATLASLSDAILLITRVGVTPKKLLRDAQKSIDGVKIIATVLNEAAVNDHQYYHRYYQQGSRRITAGSRPTGSQVLSADKK